MPTRPIQLTNVIYNAANQSFEALVTVHTGDISRRYPCAINAPISMSFEDAAEGLTKQALRRDKEVVPYSETRTHVPAQRAGRRGFDPIGWLDSIVHTDNTRAA